MNHVGKKRSARSKFPSTHAANNSACAVPSRSKIGNLNKFAFVNIRDQIHRSVRIHELFDHDSHLTALSSDGATSPDVYAGSMDTVVSTGESGKPSGG